MVKRKGYLLEKIATKENIELGDKNSRKNKSVKTRFYISQHDLNKEEDNSKILDSFKNGKYKTSKYKTDIIYEPKERILSKLPYYPDRIAHCAIMNVMKPIWIKQFVNYTYANIEGRGIHACKREVERIINKYNKKGMIMYYLQFDISKFYYNIVHRILKEILSRKIKDNKLLTILYEIIDSHKYEGKYKYVNETSGLPLGNYPSGYECNLYLDSFDRWLKEELKCKYVVRYADDVVIFSDSKEFLHKVLICSKLYLKSKLELKIKDNHHISRIDKQPINFIGYVFSNNHTKVRKSIKTKIAKLIDDYNKGHITNSKFIRSISSYFGWLVNGDCRYLFNKLCIIISTKNNYVKSNIEKLKVKYINY